jgi:hypothetical protein
MSPRSAPSVPVQSSLLASARYQAEKSTLDLEFREPGINYRYFNVPADVYTRLINAESKGSYFNTHIRNRFPYQRLLPLL